MAVLRPGDPPKASGVRLPPPTLPRCPGLRGYVQLHDAIRQLNFRHAADVLRAPAPAPAHDSVFGTLPRATTDDGFRILDGLWFPGRGGIWHRVDLPYVQRARGQWLSSSDPRADTAAALVDTLETLVRDDAMGLRRLVLWEVCCLLRDGGERPGEAEAVALGVHRGEAGPLAAAVASGFPPAGPARHAAETLNDVWPGVRLREAERVVTRLPRAADHPDGPDDHRLAALVDAVRARAAEVRRLAADGAAAEAAGAVRDAARAWLGALRLARDDADFQTGLLRVAALLAEDPTAPADSQVTAVTDERAVRLSWCAPPHAEPGAGGVSYRVLRFPDGAPHLAAETAAGESGPGALDADAPVGRPLRYAVVPLRRGRIAGVPRVTAPVLITPVVTELRATVVPGGVRLRWRADAAAAEVRVTRSGTGAETGGWGESSLVRVPCEHDRVLDVPLAPGTYTYEVRCGYRDPDGDLVWSRGVTVTARAEQWPSPVEELTVRRHADDGRVTIAWRPPELGDGLLLPWTAGPVAPGTDVSDVVGLVDRIPATASGTESWAELTPGTEQRVRVTAVSVLGERAVSGPSVVIEHPAPISELMVRRVADDRAELHFDWPEPAVLVHAAWSDGQRGGERRVPRSAHRAGRPVTLPVSAAECAITVSPLPRPDAVAIGAAPTRAVLPAAPPPPPPLPPVRPWWSAWWRRWRRQARAG
ncbi:fibronectin type III domain-containing protein [Streptomyces sp. NPDC046465]|uniref:fibronectin type III domain-containing protein n=1 Tax=Streptomyces sp. NPDC046465 TaxID=3155810 RepID=UPI0033FBC336